MPILLEESTLTSHLSSPHDWYTSQRHAKNTNKAMKKHNYPVPASLPSSDPFHRLLNEDFDTVAAQTQERHRQSHLSCP